MNDRHPTQVVREHVEERANRAGTALDPYIIKVAEISAEATPERLADAMGVSLDLLEEHGLTAEMLKTGLSQGQLPSAVVNLLVDLMHFCRRAGFGFGTCASTANDCYRQEMDAAAEVMIYGKADEVPRIFRESGEIDVTIE